MNAQPTNPPNTLHIWQQNARKSQAAHEHILNSADPKKWDLILLQEPWIDAYGNSRGNYHFQTIYPTSRIPGEENPFRSLILINTNISTDAYTQLPIHNNDITAIQLNDSLGQLSIFNIYNDCNHNETINKLDEFLQQRNANAEQARSNMMWFSDFNRHHPMWEEPRNRHLCRNSPLTDTLIDIVNRYGMNMALPEGIPTLEASSTGNWT